MRRPIRVLALFSDQVVGYLTLLSLLLAVVLLVVIAGRDGAVQVQNHTLLVQLQVRHRTTDTILAHLQADERTNKGDNTYFVNQVKALEAQDEVILADLKKLGA